jgi:phosphoglycerate kinase
LEETENLKKAVDHPATGKVIIMGGAKALTKVPVIKNFLDKSDSILIGGVIANDILKKKGVDINGSKFDDNYDELLNGLDLASPKLIMPSDYNIKDGKYLDIGPDSVKNFSAIIGQAKMIIWNGPLGHFEDEQFARATRAIGEAVAASAAFKVIGGGDTIAAINKFDLLGKFSARGGSASGGDFISTGGGAMLSFLAGEVLPGLAMLGYNISS